MKNNRPATWDMSLQQFISYSKSIRFPQRVQSTGRFGSSKQVGCHYHIYVEIDTLKTINPYTKKDAGKKYKSFFSSCSAEHAKELAYEYIKETMNGF